jgi:hypothetical protein
MCRDTLFEKYWFRIIVFNIFLAVIVKVRNFFPQTTNRKENGFLDHLDQFPWRAKNILGVCSRAIIFILLSMQRMFSSKKTEIYKILGFADQKKDCGPHLAHGP